LFLLPAVIVVVVAQKAFQLAMKVMQPLVAALPQHSGAVDFARAEHVRVIDVGLAEAMHFISKLELAAGKALEKSLALPKPVEAH
jgi:hypothetical protein